MAARCLGCICKFFLEIFVFDKQIRRILKGKVTKLCLKKYVKKISKVNVDFKPEVKKIIWQYWEQGYENAPEIVKVCMKSVEKYRNGCEYIFLDKYSLKNYAKIPDFIYELKNKGIIKPAHFSDIVRTYVLAEHGGTWVDSTVLFTDNLPEFIINSEFFVFQNELKIDLDGLNIANYFIHSMPHHIFIEKMKSFLELYWSKNNYVFNYFFYLHFFTMLTKTNNLKECFSKIPFFSFIPVQRFQSEILNLYNKERWEQIKSMSAIHKLSYKRDVLSKNKHFEIKGSYYEKLINGELNV